MKLEVFIVKFLAVIVLLVLFSCQDNEQIKFEKIKWVEQSDPSGPSPYRQKMIMDLTTNYKLTDIKYFQLIELLGIPDCKDSVSLSYKIVVDYGNDIDPVFTKDLEFKFSRDSIIKSFQIKIWEAGKQ